MGTANAWFMAGLFLRWPIRPWKLPATALELKVVTLSSSVNFIRNTAEKCRVIATATLIHVGHSTIVCRVDMKGPDGRKMVDVTGTMFVVGHFDEIPQKW